MDYHFIGFELISSEVGAFNIVLLLQQFQWTKKTTRVDNT